MPHRLSTSFDRQSYVRMCGSTDLARDRFDTRYIVANFGIDPSNSRITAIRSDAGDLEAIEPRNFMTGNAALKAAERARELLVRAVAETVLPIEYIPGRRRVFDVENPEVGFHRRSVCLAESNFWDHWHWFSIRRRVRRKIQRRWSGAVSRYSYLRGAR